MAGKKGKSGRKTKESLDYFPLYIDLFEHPKILMAMDLVDPDGLLPFLRLNCATVYILMLREIYRVGYQIPWGSNELLTFTAKVGKGLAHKHMLMYMEVFFRTHLFSRHIYKNTSMLTGGGVIEIWIDRMHRRKRIVNTVNAQHILKQIIDTESDFSSTESDFSSIRNVNSSTESDFSIHENHFPLSTTTISNNKGKLNKSSRSKLKHINSEEKSFSTEEIPKSSEGKSKSSEEKSFSTEEIPKSSEGKSKKVTMDSVLTIQECAQVYKENNLCSDARGTHMHNAGFELTDNHRYNGFVDAYVVWRISSGEKIKKMSDFCAHLFLWLQSQGNKLNGDPYTIYKFKNKDHGSKQPHSGQQTNGAVNGKQHKAGGIPADQVTEFLSRRAKPGNTTATTPGAADVNSDV